MSGDDLGPLNVIWSLTPRDVGEAGGAICPLSHSYLSQDKGGARGWVEGRLEDGEQRVARGGVKLAKARGVLPGLRD